MRGKIIPFVALLGAFAAAVHLTGRTQEEAWDKALAARLADDALGPDEWARAAQAFRAGARGALHAAASAGTSTSVSVSVSATARAEDRLEGKAKLRYLLALGYSMKDLGTDIGGGTVDATRADLTAVSEGMAAATERERRATEAVESLLAANLDVAGRFLFEATDAAVRRRTAQALGLLSDAKALPLLRKAMAADPDEGVRASALASGTTVAMRAGDQEALAALLLEAAPRKELAPRAVGTAAAVGGRRMAPVLLSILEAQEGTLPERDRRAAVEALVAAAGPGAPAPAGQDAASLRAWWNSLPEKK